MYELGGLWYHEGTSMMFCNLAEPFKLARPLAKSPDAPATETPGGVAGENPAMNGTEQNE